MIDIENAPIIAKALTKEDIERINAKKNECKDTECKDKDCKDKECKPE
eukprot:CAMPEP_0201583324 /NCGR_PEP_ID=MMETSP0190_2-20130828/97248_1 /ASSEMBLY_ACC=CAM_ASM_000263 /TAXON_ID=37353 /ORGANISM="Rosalina sp." /LENGTH=47 /DNA_ID= /DNA_START= /DNA_END= /DNA_ORIENTATION=